MTHGEGKAAKTLGLADSDFLTVPPKPRCPVCWGISCPRCHRADRVKVIWDIPLGSWHGICQRCQKGFPADD